MTFVHILSVGGEAAARAPITRMTNHTGSAQADTQFTAPSRRRGRFGAVIAGAALLLGSAFAVADNLPDFATLIEKEGAAVVQVSVEIEQAGGMGIDGMPGFNPEDLPEYFRRFFEDLPQGPNQGPRRGAGFGSGFIISDDGYIITNAHVVDGATDIRISLNDQREYAAELVGADATTDIALLKVNADELPTVDIGDSDSLKTGQWVLAIGSPFGFEHTATQGIVSALARSLPSDSYVPFIQTDVAVNPGNSGGPLFNTDGEVIGVNSQIFSRSGGYQGLSFAIPINVAMSVADQLRTQGYATRGWLGVRIQNMDKGVASAFGLDRPSGALVSEVTPDSPALKAGVKEGDVIVAFNGREVTSSSSLPPLVGAVAPGTKVKMDVLRDGKPRTLNVTIDALEQDMIKTRAQSAAAEPQREQSNRLGVTVESLSDDLLAGINANHGVLVTDVDGDSPAAAAGIMADDVIVSLNRRQIETVEDLGSALEDAPSGKAVPVLINRGGSPMFLALTLEN